MSHGSVRRLVAAGVLAAILGLAGPAQAGAGPLGHAGSWWQRLTAFWEESVGRLGLGSKAGSCVDPDGKPIPCPEPNRSTPSPAKPACMTWDTAGSCLQPEV
jgi:hypothetical protein